MSISTKNIAELRNRTSAGLSDCKKALTEAEGDMEKAMEILRQKGIASASKKAGKIAAEGAVCAQVNGSGDKAVIIELNAQTDFVAKNENFKNMLDQLIRVALREEIYNLDELKNCKVGEGENANDTVETYVSVKIGQIGEKIDLRRVNIVKADKANGESLFTYTHPIGSKIAVLGKLKNGNDQLGKDLGMHIAAFIPQPEYLVREDIPQEAFDEETRIEMGKEDLANKPEQIREKIVTGRVEKVLLEKVLTEQSFVKDPSKKIKDLLKENNNAQILEFVRYNLGEGIEKKIENFAEEVAAQTRG